MNVGDRVYCIRDIDTKFLNLVSVGSKNVMFKLFISGRCYRVLRINEDSIILNCEFSYCEISGIQKNYLNDMLNESVENENYEIAAKVRDRIKNFT